MAGMVKESSSTAIVSGRYCKLTNQSERVGLVRRARWCWTNLSARLVVALLLLLCCSCSDVEATYEFPDISTGFVVAQDRVSVLMAIEMWDTNRFAGDFIMAEDLAAVGLGWRATSIFEIKVGCFYGWDFSLDSPTYGIAFLMTEF